jgi:ABC-2 type transport system permease protein
MPDVKMPPAAGRNLKRRAGFGLGFQNTLTFAYRSMLKAVRQPDILMDIIMMPILFTLMFAYLFGGAIAGSVAGYLPLCIPAVFIQTLITSCGTSGTQLREDADKSVTSRFKSMPIAQIAQPMGILTADLARYAITGAVVFSVGAVIGYRPEAGIFAVLAAMGFMMLIAWCFSWLFAFVSMSVRSISSTSSMVIMITLPLMFLSNAFVPVDTLPHWIRFFAERINPVSKAVTAVRLILSEGRVGGDFWLALAGALGILAVFIPLTLRAYQRKG